MLRLARWITALRRPPDVSWLQGRAEKLPLPDDQATVVWAISSAHRWEDRGTGIGEAWRVLAPGERLVLAERLARLGSRVGPDKEPGLSPVEGPGLLRFRWR